MAEKQLDYDYSITDGQNFVNESTSNNVKTLSTGIKTKDEIQALKDLVLSKRVFHIKDDQLIPVIIEIKSLKIFNNEEKDLPTATLKFSSANRHSHA